jgi:hypothetical protein
MRAPHVRRLTLLVVSLVGAAVLPSAASAPLALSQPIPLGVPVTSPNVTYVGTVPFDVPGVGGEVVDRPDLGGRYFYATGAYGLSIYDVGDPANPARVGYLPFPHSQNEDLKVSDDGTRAVIAADGSLPFSPNYVTTGIHIVDTTDVTAPVIVGSTSPLVRGSGAGTGTAEHTVACADAGCTFLYGSTTGSIYDATDPADIRVVGTWNRDRDGATVGSRHALNRDASGLLVSDSTPRLVIDPVGVVAAGATPGAPVVLAQGTRAGADPRLQHNNVRPDAEAWTARGDDPVAHEVVTASPRSVSIVDERPVLAPGELLIGQSESNVNPQCVNGGGLSTWSMVNFDRGSPMVQLELFQPLNGTWADGSPAANVAGCSGHWFTERDGIVAGAWYEHGVRFFEVDKRLGTIREVGFHQPVAGIASAAYWVDDEYVYTVDNLRGIDILRFDRDAEAASPALLQASWLAGLAPTDARVAALAASERLRCRLAVAD